MSSDQNNGPDGVDLAFDRWMADVDAYFLLRLGLSADDLPDYCYRDAYDDGATPTQAARAALRAARE